MLKIIVLDGYTENPGDNPWDPVSRLGELTVHDHTSDHQVLDRARGFDIVVVNKTPVTGATIQNLPDLKFITVLATGYNIIDIEAAAKRGIPVSNVPIYGTDSVAQFVFALLLELCHHVAVHDQAVKAGEWTKCRDFSFWKTPLIELAGKTMGIIGFGRIGRRTGEIANAFGMKVIAHDVYQGDVPAYKSFAWRSIEQIFAESDVISLHCNLTAENKGMVNQGQLSRMKRNAFLINTSRGPLVNEPDLAKALNEGRLAGAAVDVVAEEPIRADNPLLKAKNILITPHIAWAALEPRQRIMQMTADNIAAFQKGKPINVVNAQQLRAHGHPVTT